MELPRALRQAVDTALQGVAARDLAAASDALSRRYRAELRDGRLHVGDELAAQAYLAARLPATYAAIRAALDAVALVRPDFAPRSLLDFGAGPGTALWAARDCWPDLDTAALVEASAAMRKFGAAFAPRSGVTAVDWHAAPPSSGARDLATVAYVLDELDPAQRSAVIQQIWSLTGDTLLVVEPGTPAGWRRILDARDLLLRQGAHVVAPCPHADTCPLVAPDWCHFARRVARSRAHLQAKGAEVPWEDEKFSFLAVSRRPGPLPASRVIAPPRTGSGKVELKLCQQNGAAGSVLVTRRSGERYKTMRRLSWGDAVC
jgi:ribosomal protein RSM22 (predicted rRNA methylase)